MSEPLNVAEIEVLAAMVLGAVVIAWALTYAILRAANMPAPAMLVVSLSVLTLVALFGALLSSSQAMETIAATGVGALAGVVSQQLGSRDE